MGLEADRALVPLLGPRGDRTELLLEALAWVGVMMIRENTFAFFAPGSIRAKSMMNSEWE
jgi:hypothetical protein